MTRKEKRAAAEVKREEIRTMYIVAFQQQIHKGLEAKEKPTDVLKAAGAFVDGLAAEMISKKPQEAEMFRQCLRDVGRKLGEEFAKIRDGEKKGTETPAIA